MVRQRQPEGHSSGTVLVTERLSRLPEKLMACSFYIKNEDGLFVVRFK